MRLLGFQNKAALAMPETHQEPPRGGLRAEDPDLYGGLLDQWIGDDAHLRPYAQGLRSGETVVVLTGQQPALLGGPLYTLYKAMTAIMAARRLREDGRSAIAAFWCVGDDTDHDEVASASWPRRGRAPARVRDVHPARGERIGGLDVDRMRGAITQIAEDWPRAVFVHNRLREIEDASAREGWSGFLRRSLRALVREEPLLFVDGNDPKVIAASQGFLRGFVPHRSAMAEEIDARARAVQARGENPAVSGEQALRCLFVVDRAGRRVLGANEEPVSTAQLLPNVLLRPAVQEHLLPVHRVVCGEAEIAYRRLLAPVYARVGRPAAALMSRFGATIFPSLWSRDPETPDPLTVLQDPDAALAAWASARLDPGVAGKLEALRRRAAHDLQALEQPLAGVDRSLTQVLDSVTGKVDFQIQRLQDAVLAKGRHALLRAEPDLAHLRETLRPRGKLQERGFAMWTPLLYEGESSLQDLWAAVERWFSRGESGHALLSCETEE